MYVVDIWNSKTKADAGPRWFTDTDDDSLTLSEALSEAKKWVAGKPNPEDYEVFYRIVGCL